MENENKEKSQVKKKTKGTKPSIKINNREKTALIGLVLLVVLVILILSLSCTREKKPATVYKTVKDEPTFIAEGELFFMDAVSGDTIKNIIIEIADNDEDRAQGMMYRSEMADSLGMLFVFDQPKKQSFWMKNTPLSLDIMYVDESGAIESLYKNTTPYSTSKIPSVNEAKYVVEVTGGFTDRYEINVGDMIAYVENRLQPRIQSR